MAAGVFVVVRTIGVPFLGGGCEATVDGVIVGLDDEQARSAALIGGTAVARGLPARAATIALATAYQESDLRNLDYGDRDSLGLFQQRPSQGWGSAAEVQDPVYSTNRFYDELVGIDGYREMAVTEAAQAVQRSAFPGAYADHEEDARVLASAFTGYSPAAFTCSIGAAEGAAEEPTDAGLTPRAQQALDEMREVFGPQSVGGFEPGGVSAGHIDGSAHYEGRAVDVFFRPVSPESQRAGWATAHWLVANADRLELATLIFDAQIWSARRSDDGWRPYEPPGGPTDNETLLHLDHVHLDVA